MYLVILTRNHHIKSLSVLVSEALTFILHYFIAHFKYIKRTYYFITLTLRVKRKFSIAVTVCEHTRGIKFPQSTFSIFLWRTRNKDLVVVGEAQQTHYLGERQIAAVNTITHENVNGWFIVLTCTVYLIQSNLIVHHYIQQIRFSRKHILHTPHTYTDIYMYI